MARRPIFETRVDARFFLSLVARSVRAGRLVVHAFVVLTTHYHLLVASPEGRLAAAMQWIQDLYARRFNSRRDRQGPVFGSRYHERLVDSIAYRNAVVWYVDQNPVKARLVEDPRDYSYGSAWCHARRKKGPPWLERDLVERIYRSRLGAEARAEGRGRAARALERLASLVERLLARPSLETAPFDDLLRAAEPEVRDWLMANALNADGTPAGVVLLPPEAVLEGIAAAREGDPERTVPLGKRSRGVWDLLGAGLLRLACGIGVDEAAKRLGISPTSVVRHSRDHASAMRTVPAYRDLASRIVAQEMRASLRPLVWDGRPGSGPSDDGRGGGIRG